jgi:SSS family transporter
VAVYVALGGLLSAVFNEVLQFFLIWLGTLLVPVLGLIEVGGWSGMMDAINTANPGQDFTSLWANMGSADHNPMGMHWAGMVFGLGLAVSFGYWCTDFLQVQRVLTARSLRDAQNGTIIGAAFKMMVPLIVTLPGLLGLAILAPKAGINLLPEHEAVMTDGYSYNMVLPLMMARYLGPGLLGLGVTAMIAGFMSGMAGNVSAFATVWTYDVYRPLLNKNAPDSHYVKMGRWCSILGVIVAIGTAYAAMLFSNILVYLQVLVLFFIVPLFGVVLTGMLWKQATPAGGFWGLLLGTLASIFMFFYVHWFPQGYAPLLARDVRDLPAMAARLQRPAEPSTQWLREQLAPATREILDRYDAAARAAQAPQTLGAQIIAALKEADKDTRKLTTALVADLNKALANPAALAALNGAGASASQLEGDALLRQNRQALHRAFAGELAPMRRLEATQLNPVHAEHIATSPKAQDMAVNMFSAFWSLLFTIGIAIMVSLFTTPKPDHEIRELVYGLAPLPNEGACPWFKKPVFWAAVVMAVLVVANLVFW